MTPLSEIRRLPLLDRRRFLAGCGASALALAVLPPARAASALPTVIAERSKHLAKGLNASQWFEWVPRDPQTRIRHLDKYRREDFAQIRALGFDHIRVTLQPGFTAPNLRDGKSALDAGRLALLDEAMSRILENDLALVLDCHPDKIIKDKIAREANFSAVMADWWQAFAAHVHGQGQYAADRVFLELLNEPEVSFDDQTHYRRVIESFAAAARRGAPDHTLIVGGNRWNVAEALFQGADSRTPGLGQPLGDPNIVYTFHFYNPMEFTHQALANAGERYANLKGVPWNVDAGAISAADIDRADPKVRKVLENYNGKPRRKADLRWQFSELRKWCDARGQFAWLGEFGVFDRAADPRQRAAWIRDVRELAEEHGFGWCHYEARGGFGLFEPGDERPLKVRNPILAALGMIAHEKAER